MNFPEIVDIALPRRASSKGLKNHTIYRLGRNFVTGSTGSDTYV
jgi:hypothetical protein